MKDANYYSKLPYTVVLRPDEDGDYVARVDELPGCAAHGKTAQEALENLEEAKQLWIVDCLERGDPIPEPLSEEELPSGKWVQRIPRSLHGRLVALAKREKVSLNQLVTSILAEAVGSRKTIQQQVSSIRDFTEHWISGSTVKNLEIRDMTKDWHIIEGSGSHVMLTPTLRIMGRQIPNRRELELKGFTYAYKQETSHKHK